MANNCLVVNLFGVPSAGKSTGAAYIFSKLKLSGVNTELITEFAKDMVWEDNIEVFKPDNQCYIFGEQFYRMSRCRDKVSVIVTDSPLPLSIMYNQSEVLGETFNQTVMNCFNSFHNLSYLILRDKPYNPIGRRHTEEESNALKADILDFLDDREIQYEPVKGNVDEYDKIVDEVLQALFYTLKEGRDSNDSI